MVVYSINKFTLWTAKYKCFLLCDNVKSKNFFKKHVATVLKNLWTFSHSYKNTNLCYIVPFSLKQKVQSIKYKDGFRTTGYIQCM